MELISKYLEGIAIGNLADIVVGEFGTGVRVFGCWAASMTLLELTQFLGQQDKVWLYDAFIFSVDPKVGYCGQILKVLKLVRIR